MSGGAPGIGAVAEAAAAAGLRTTAAAGPSLPLRALIFDVDGTLAETERDGHRVAFNQAFAEAGLPWHWDAAVYGEWLRVTGGKERMRAWWQHTDPAGLAAATDAEARIAALHRRKSALYQQMVRAGQVRLRPGVERLLREARAAGLQLAIATTTQEANVRELVEATLGPAAMEWFAVVGAGDVVAAKKPAPDIYHWVLARLGLPAGACVVFEDSRPGVAAALAAGVPTVLVRGLYTDPGPMPGVWADVDGWGGAPPARGCWAGRPWSGTIDVPTLRAGPG